MNFYPGCFWVEINIGWSNKEIIETGNEFMHDILLTNYDSIDDQERSVYQFLEVECRNLELRDPTKACKFLSAAPSVDSVKGLVDAAVEKRKQQNKNQKDHIVEEDEGQELETSIASLQITTDRED